MSRCQESMSASSSGGASKVDRPPRSMPPVNGAGSDQPSTSTRGTVSQATVTSSSWSATRWGSPAQNTAHTPIGQVVAAACVLQYRCAAERQDELDVVVPVGARHRGHQGQAAGQAEDLVQRRDAITRGSGKYRPPWGKYAGIRTA